MNEPMSSKSVFYCIVVLFSLVTAGFLVASINPEPEEYQTVKIRISTVSPCRDLVDISTANQPIDIFNLMRENECLPNNKVTK